MLKVDVNKNIIQDAVNLYNGVYAPLTGFLGRKDYFSVIHNMRLASGGIWSIPIVFDIDEEIYNLIKSEDSVVLKNGNTEVLLVDLEIYKYNKKELAELVYKTIDDAHPGVSAVYAMGDYLVGGKVAQVIGGSTVYPEQNLTPAETKKEFSNRGFESIVAFQTRNVPHGGHEFIQKHALEGVDGLFVHPVVGDKKEGDFKDEHIISTYKILIDKHFPENKAMLGALPLKMRYAGPREAVMHALIRRNYGCTHFIVGRDHAGVGDYYEPTAAQDIFDEFHPDELGIEILKYNEVVYDKANEKHCFIGECEEDNKFKFSGTRLREILKNSKEPPEYFVRKSVYEYLAEKGVSGDLYVC